ncbi:MAG TPA: hypothetical protein VNH19_18225 [Candidatus Limnocylindrales bacterium]|nr:hypothetical protein [Candidatus Limnocylindrales bacterium]
MNPRAQWLTASPLWDDFASHPDAGEFRQPVTLRFNTDKFMDELQGVLAAPPVQLRQYIAQPENWRNPAVGVAADWISAGKLSLSATGEDQPTHLKLYQPVHGMFYLATASLTCRLPGLPDHRVKADQGDKVSMVLRRLQANANSPNADLSVFDPATCDEYAWIGKGSSGVWAKVESSTDSSVIPGGEERLPSFMLPFTNKDRARTLIAGLVPTGRQSSYVAGRKKSSNGSGPGPDPAPDDARKIDFQRQVVDPWGDLTHWYWFNFEQGSAPANPTTEDLDSIVRSSALVLLDFANFLLANLNIVWQTVLDPSQENALPPKAKALFELLKTPSSSGPSLLNSMKTAKQKESGLNDGSYTPVSSDIALLTDTGLRGLIWKTGGVRPVNQACNDALDEAGPAATPAIRVPAMPPQSPSGNDWYIIRFLYERPQCKLLSPPVISDPCRPFQMASYFDPDAPARSLQVALPIDTSAAALRKYDKGVAFLISDQLAKQMSRVKGLKQLMDGDMGPELGIGMICSFSIPIITICAMIVLMIFVILLNLIFFWLPFLKICFPVPELKAKG